MKNFLLCMLGLAGFALAAAPLEASIVLTAEGSALNVAAAPSPGNEGYIFFSVDGSNGPGTNLSSLPAFVSSVDTTGDLEYGGEGYSTLTVNGTPHRSGVVYQSNTSSGTLAVIHLGSDVPSAFLLGLLGNNTDASENNTAYSVLASGGAMVTGLNSPTPSGVVDQNDFYFVEVQGAAPGDTLTITGTGTQITLGGITFDTPEPAPVVAIIGLGGMGLIGFAFRRRRRRA